MGIHSTRKLSEAKFVKHEDTVNGGKVNIYDETGTKQGEVTIDSAGNLSFNAPSNFVVFQQGGVKKFSIKGSVTDMEQLVNFKAHELYYVAEGTGASDPTTDAPDGWITYRTQAGNPRYIPFYT